MCYSVQPNAILGVTGSVANQSSSTSGSGVNSSHVLVQMISGEALNISIPLIDRSDTGDELGQLLVGVGLDIGLVLGDDILLLIGVTNGVGQIGRM